MLDYRLVCLAKARNGTHANDEQRLKVSGLLRRHWKNGRKKARSKLSYEKVYRYRMMA